MVSVVSLMQLPSFNTRYVVALRSSFLRFPENKLQIHVHGRDVATGNSSRRQASVLVPLCNRNGVPSILFTVRTKTVGSHKGHVSFPGGHRETGETAEAAALREFQEEMHGLHSLASTDRCCKGVNTSGGEGALLGFTGGTGVEVIGECQTIPALTGTIVTPIVGFVKQDVGDLSCFTPDSREVHHIFSRSLEELLAPGSRQIHSYTHQGVEMALPEWGQGAGDERIWGLTACILEAVLDQLIVPLIRKKKEKEKGEGGK